MNDTYVEYGVKQKGTAKTFLCKAAFIAAIIVGLFISTLSQFLYVVPVVAVMLAFYFIPKFNYEYEYIYVDGEFNFDRIMGGAKRKTILKIDLENVEMIAPSDSEEIVAYNHKEGMKDYNFSSLMPDAKTYTLIGSVEGNYLRVVFEPNEKMIESARAKSRSKVRA